MSEEEKATRRIDRYRKLEEANPEKYCWADLVTRALEKNVYDRMERGCTSGDRCKLESADVGYCYVEFRYKGELYRFEHSVEKAKARGLNLQYGSDAFAQVVLALEDLARMVERGIYDLGIWVAGMKYLPPAIEIPSFLKFLRFEQIPSSIEDINKRYRQLTKEMHPDTGGNKEDFEELTKAAERATKYMSERK